MPTIESYIRGQRTIGIVHGEAFQLMLYRAEDGAEAWFWNSRDGVTPFGTAIEGKQYRHAMHGYPTGYYGALPDKAEFVWVTHTRATWEVVQRRTFDRYTAEAGEWGADFRERFPAFEDWLQASPFEHGQPHQVTREVFLAETPEWMGKAA